MKRRPNDFFIYTSSEKKGFIFLSVLLAFVLAIYWILPFLHSGSNYDFSKFENDVELFLEDDEKEKAEVEESEVHPDVQDSLYRFNPNLLSIVEWEGLGFSQKQAASIVKYKEKYGFSSKTDLQKLYVISDEKYKQLESYITIDSKHKKHIKSENVYNNKKEKHTSFSLKENFINTVVELNMADTTELKMLKGIGSSYAKRIVKYRDLLGGFYSVDQLIEVYGLSEDVIIENKFRIEIDTTFVERMNINNCLPSDLKKHPYINWNLANSIVQIRKNHGDYKVLEEIKKSDLVNDEIYRKIAPYLKIE